MMSSIPTREASIPKIQSNSNKGSFCATLEIIHQAAIIIFHVASHLEFLVIGNMEKQGARH